MSFLSHVLALVTVFSSSVISIKPIIWEEQLLWVSSEVGYVHTYRIPIIINASNGDLLAFAEARKFGAGDAGAKYLAMRRSKDTGISWLPTEFILDNYIVQDGLNLGVVMHDYEVNTMILLYNFCGHSNTTKCMLLDKQESGVYMIQSNDNGFTWSNPVYLGESNPELIHFQWAAGPGQGIQKMHSPHRGRLVACGHMNNNEGDHSMVCLYSDDHGFTWHKGGKILSLPLGQKLKMGDLAPGETQIVELTDGSLLATIRNTHWYHCHCRIHAYSYDAGETFPTENIYFDKVLLEPNVCGSLLLHGGTLFFANAFHYDKRENMTLRWSPDLGATWPGALPVYPGSSAYPCLTSIDDNHIGLIYEKNDYKQISFVKVRLNL